jgi:N6-adenosine-specific RNA methylase IME4
LFPRSFAPPIYTGIDPHAVSRKPDEAYARIEQYSAGPRADLFARERRRGWDFFGDELVWKDAAA